MLVNLKRDRTIYMSRIYENSSCYEKFTIKEEKKEIHRTNSKFIDLIIIYLQTPTAIRIPT
jgi:hypothetical protein